MVTEKIEDVVNRAHFEEIEGEDCFYGESEEFKGLWATGATLDECKDNLKLAVRDWLRDSTNTDFPISALEEFGIDKIREAGIV